MVHLDVKWNTWQFQWTGLFIVVILVSTGTSSSVNDCRGIQLAYQQRDLHFDNVLRQPAQGSHLVVCPGGLTCCTRDMEQKLWSSAKENYERAMRSIASPVQKTFGNGANKFDNFFTSLLDESKIKLNALFEKTYGAIYLQNSDVFDDFFVNLEKYYKHGDVDLEDALQDFFSRLYQRMFTVFNVQSSFDYV